MKKLLVVVAAATLLGGCMSTTQYNWGEYEGNLYGYYKNPTGEAQLTQSLDELLNDQYLNKKVPPGLYAEYGFLLLKAGKTDEARLWFQKEQEKWPESTVFMQTLLKEAKATPPQTAGK